MGKAWIIELNWAYGEHVAYARVMMMQRKAIKKRKDSAQLTARLLTRLYPIIDASKIQRRVAVKIMNMEWESFTSRGWGSYNVFRSQHKNR